ncbi:unnamed protein product, partial [marine sediment metagenome]
DINGFANDEEINFAASDLDGDTNPDQVHVVDIGGGNSVEIDFEGDLLRVGGTIGIEIDGFVYLSSDFAFEKSDDPVTVTLSDVDSTEVLVEVMTIGATDVTAFAGVNGPADQDGAMGLSMSGIDIGLVLMKVSDPDNLHPEDTRSWMALKAEVDDISFIGIDDLTISLTDFAVLFNRASGDDNGAANYAVDFAASGAYSIDVGDGEAIEIDFADGILKVG